MEDDNETPDDDTGGPLSWRGWLLFWLIVIAMVTLLTWALNTPCEPKPGRDCHTPGYDEIYILYVPWGWE